MLKVILSVLLCVKCFSRLGMLFFSQLLNNIIMTHESVTYAFSVGESHF